MDAIKETMQKAGHRVEEAATEATHTAQEMGDKIKETVMGGTHETESAATKTSHAASEAAQSTGQRAEETAEKAKHGMGIHQ